MRQLVREQFEGAGTRTQTLAVYASGALIANAVYRREGTAGLRALAWRRANSDLTRRPTRPPGGSAYGRRVYLRATFGRTTLKWRRSVVSRVRERSRSAVAATVASTKPSGRSAY